MKSNCKDLRREHRPGTPQGHSDMSSQHLWYIYISERFHDHKPPVSNRLWRHQILSQKQRVQ